MLAPPQDSGPIRTMNTTTTEAKDTLLRALEQLEQAEQDLNAQPERVDVIVIYSIGRNQDDEWHEIAGWSATGGPKWVHAALLQRAADAQHQASSPTTSTDDEDTESPGTKKP